MPEASGSYCSLIQVRSIYPPALRIAIRDGAEEVRTSLAIGMNLFHNEVLGVVGANNHRIRKPDGSFGLYVDQLSVKNLYGLRDGSRMHDARVQILDAYLQAVRDAPDGVNLIE